MSRIMYTEQQLQKTKFTGLVFKCEFALGWIDKYPCEDVIGDVVFFEDEGWVNTFIEDIKNSGEYCGISPKPGEWLLVRLGEYRVENGCIDFDSGIRKSSNVIYEA